MKLKVMLVEDSPMIIKGLQYTMAQAGYEVDTFMTYEQTHHHSGKRIGFSGSCRGLKYR